jgi:hypothetical protein
MINDSTAILLIKYVPEIEAIFLEYLYKSFFSYVFLPLHAINQALSA